LKEFENSTMECWNVEALAEIPLRREKNGRSGEWENSTIRQWEEWKIQSKTADFILPMPHNWQLATADLRLPPPRLPTADFRLLAYAFRLTPFLTFFNEETLLLHDQS